MIPTMTNEFSFLKKYFKLEDNYNIVLISAIHQHDSPVGIHMYPP